MAQLSLLTALLKLEHVQKWSVLNFRSLFAKPFQEDIVIFNENLAMRKLSQTCDQSSWVALKIWKIIEWAYAFEFLLPDT